jgi:Ca2+/H+ antiporter, TMEM165/GDT1 family
LLVFGLQWLRKAILRASGLKAIHDEEATFAEKSAAARSAGQPTRHGRDWYSFTVAFKGVLLEGLEVAFIVVTFGASQGNLPLAIVAAAAAVVIVLAVGVAVRQPLTRVPETPSSSRLVFSSPASAPFGQRKVPASSGRPATLQFWY